MVTISPFDSTRDPSGQGFPPPTNPSVSRYYVRLGVLLVLMGIICVLLLEGLLGFPGIFFWFIGGDLMQFWFLVLVVLGFLYLGALSHLLPLLIPHFTPSDAKSPLRPPFLPLASSTWERVPGMWCRFRRSRRGRLPSAPS